MAAMPLLDRKGKASRPWAAPTKDVAMSAATQRFRQQCIDERFGIEHAQVFNPFADAGIADGDAELARQREHHAALRRTVELGDHQAGDADGGVELAQLGERVLPGGAVADHQRLVRRGVVDLAQYAADLAQFVHQAGLRVQPARGVGDQHVEAARPGRLQCIERDRRGIRVLALRADLVALLAPVAQPLLIDRNARPFVLLTVGVNGVGKTTTIGKLARRFKDEGRNLMLAAGDTFRAAAVAQLQAWGERHGVTVIAQGQNADPASVAFDALQAARARGTEVLIADTAGRLHTQTGLMNELGKIKRVLQKLDPAAPHEVLMVIDGTTGQNALSQLRQFHAAVGVTGLVVTKLDGTAKGGVLFALAREFGIPIRYAGIGERPEDLRVFDAEAFVDALLPESLGG